MSDHLAVELDPAFMEQNTHASFQPRTSSSLQSRLCQTCYLNLHCGRVWLQGKVKEFFVQRPFTEVSGTKLLCNLPQPAPGKEPVEGFSSHGPQVSRRESDA